jgi:hypothetical protein
MNRKKSITFSLLGLSLQGRSVFAQILPPRQSDMADESPTKTNVETSTPANSEPVKQKALGRTPFSDLIFSNNDGVESGQKPVDSSQDNAALDHLGENTSATSSDIVPVAVPTEGSEAKSENAANNNVDPNASPTKTNVETSTPANSEPVKQNALGRTPFSDLIFSNNDGVESGPQPAAKPVDNLQNNVDFLNSTSTEKATKLTETATVQEIRTTTTTTTVIKDVAPTKGSVVESENAAKIFDSFKKEYMKEFNIAPNGDVDPTSKNPMDDVQGTLDPLAATGNQMSNIHKTNLTSQNPMEDGIIFISAASNTMALGVLLSIIAFLI